ncbi:MAG: formylglycine-generating enzyme family protein [Deltaproteobacteria bacterium]|jgi:hypothetical protein|nr:formylglycine-generating enzyme family protein [Deltaproteobacteria bacterium]
MFKNFILALAAVAIFMVVSPAPLGSQLATKGGPAKSTDAYNPRPDPADIVFPLPCDLKMVFKAISLFGVEGRLGDLDAPLGTDDDNPNGFFDRKYRAHLGSALSLADLPPDQRAIAENAIKNPVSGELYGDQIFLFGKYEVTNAQWAAVMEGCGPLKPDAALPKTGISWYEALSFTEKYMTFLLKNHPEYLPSFPDDTRNVGLIRLPTDAEWEYAARGGHAVTVEDFKTYPLFRHDGAQEAEYGLFIDGASPPAPGPRVGRFRPNPVGVYDTVGNVAEMTFDLFKMTIGSRLHGATGGFIRKGGSFRSEAGEILPGRRLEVAHFYREGPTRSNDLGFRLVLSAVAAPGGTRFKQIAEEWRQIGRPRQVETGLDPLEKLNRLIEKASSDEERATFNSLKNDFQSYNVSVAKEKEAAVRAHCKNLLNTAYSIHNTDRRRRLAAREFDKMNENIAEITKAIKSAPAAQRAELNELAQRMQNMRADIKNDVDEFELAISNQFTYYKALLYDATEFDQDTLINQMRFVFNDIKGTDIYHRQMRQFYEIVDQHLAMAINNEYNDKLMREDLFSSLRDS